MRLFDDSLNDLVQRISPGGRLIRAWPLAGGISAEMTALEVEAGGIKQKYILRVPGLKALEIRPDTARIEFKNLRLVHRLSLPAPKPLLLDQSREIFDRDYLVLEYIEGQPLFTLADPDDMLRQMAGVLASIHRADIRGQDVSHLQYFSDLGCAEDQPPSALLSTVDLDRIRAVMAKAPPRGSNPTSLLHSDFWPGNLLWQDGKIAAVIDWEDACLGDPLIDLAGCRMETAWIFGPDACADFSRHYLELNPIDTANLPFYDLCVALRLAGLIGSDLESWAAFFVPFGQADITPQTIRHNFGWYIQQAIEKYTRKDFQYRGRAS